VARVNTDESLLTSIPTNAARGFAMGAADVVPGVSGGTVALVLGIYKRLISSIRNGSSAVGRLGRGDGSGAAEALRAVDWVFLVSLLGGIGVAIVVLAGPIETLLEDRPSEMAGLFLGLVAGSVVVAWRLVDRKDGTRVAVAIGVAVAMFLLLGLRTSTSSDVEVAGADISPLIFLGSGAIAICAMILPGISGSFLLLMMGMYGAVIGAVNERDFLSLGAFALGAAVGLGLFSQLLHWLLSRHAATVIAAMTGLMLGSVRVLWPWPDGVNSTRLGAPAGSVVAPVLLALVGFVVVVGFDTLARHLEHRKIADEVDELESV
jgi:putative membrane protein